MDDIYIESVTIQPNPVPAGTQFKIEVAFYALYPSDETYPGTETYPGAYNFMSGTYPGDDTLPGLDVLPGPDSYV